jgi:hypothetical protein
MNNRRADLETIQPDRFVVNFRLRSKVAKVEFASLKEIRSAHPREAGLLHMLDEALFR